MNACLSYKNSLKLRVKSRLSIDITTKSLLNKLSSASGEDVVILGEASNVVLPEVLYKTVAWIKLKGIEVVGECEHFVDVSVAAGESWHAFVQHALKQRWYGVENLALIPGTVGAAPVQNIGAYGVSLADRLVSCEVWDRDTRTAAVMTKDMMQLGYRTSIFKTPGYAKKVIISVRLRLLKKPVLEVSYPRLSAYLSQRFADDYTAHDVFDAVCAIRRSRLPDTNTVGTVGSFFINPVLTQSQWTQVARVCKGVDRWYYKDGRVKLFAGNLLKRSGWAGWQEGGLRLCSENPIVLINTTPTRAVQKDVAVLVEKVQASVMRVFQVPLEIEPRWIDS